MLLPTNAWKITPGISCSSIFPSPLVSSIGATTGMLMTWLCWGITELPVQAHFNTGWKVPMLGSTCAAAALEAMLFISFCSTRLGAVQPDMDRRVTEGQYTKTGISNVACAPGASSSSKLTCRAAYPAPGRTRRCGCLVKGNDLDACRGFAVPMLATTAVTWPETASVCRVRCRTRSRERLHRKVGQELRDLRTPQPHLADIECFEQLERCRHGAAS